MLVIDTPVQFIKGIGPRIAESLAQKGISTAEDLLYHLPFRYEDRANPRAVDELAAGEMASVIGEVRGSVLLRTRAMPIFEMTLGQGMSTLKCIWFRGTYLKDRFQAGQTVAVFGKVEASRSSRAFKMIQPQFEILPDSNEEFSSLEMGRITPIYESLGGSKLGSRWIRRQLFSVLAELRGNIPETLPALMMERLDMPSRDASLHQVHFPDIETPLNRLQAASTPAHQRLIFEELFFLELGSGDQAAQGEGASRHRICAG